MFRVPITGMLNAFSAWWHMVGVLVFVAVLIIVPDTHKSVGYVFGETLNNTGFSGTNFSSIVFFYVFVTGLLMAQYTITGFDASAHMSEETRQASLRRSLGHRHVGCRLGDLRLHPADRRDVRVAQRDERRVRRRRTTNPHVRLDERDERRAGPSSSSSSPWSRRLFCTIASTTSASRMMFAFSRDGAVPGHRWWRGVSKRERVPVNMRRGRSACWRSR